MYLSQAVQISQIQSLVQKPPASAGGGLQSSEVWPWGVLGVTLGWHEPEPGPSTARWDQPGQVLGTAIAALCKAVLAPPAPTWYGEGLFWLRHFCILGPYYLQINSLPVNWSGTGQV